MNESGLESGIWFPAVVALGCVARAALLGAHGERALAASPVRGVALLSCCRWLAWTKREREKDSWWFSVLLGRRQCSHHGNAGRLRRLECGVTCRPAGRRRRTGVAFWDAIAASSMD
ncbi:hypothetical protein B0T18DRAFT_124653 [Schizothecium vesticola]|uniref:Uncharacterized protein n=1 Tax=Schizothecium vesticola TaxID=314040 RepID=A0AA40F378_9PEZI|nr:hypothetical protein B0T18DRAFT_124653 [Schizothecium vesticola]